MRPRFQADNDLDQRIVVATLRLDPSIDFRAAPAAGLHNMPDDEVLAYASREGPVLVSHDRKTMPEHFRRFLAAGQTSSGLSCPSAGPPSGSTCCRRPPWRKSTSTRFTSCRKTRESISS